MSPELNCTSTVVGGTATVKWNDIGQASTVVWDRGVAKTVAGLQYSDTTPETSYLVIAVVNGVKYRATCDTIKPPATTSPTSTTVPATSTTARPTTTTAKPTTTTARPTTTAPTPPATLVCQVARRDGKAIVTWNDIGQSSNYVWDHGAKMNVSGRTYTDPTPETQYVVVALVGGVKVRATCSMTPGTTTTARPTTTVPGTTTAKPTTTTAKPTTTTVKPTTTTVKPTTTTVKPTTTTAKPTTTTTAPVTPPVCQRLEGPNVVAEGSDGQYRVVLNKAANKTMTFQVVVSDGTAHRVGDVAGKEAQDIMWTGHYILRTTWYFLGIPIRSSDQIIYDRVANGTGGGDRPMVGPKEVNWDFTLYQNGVALNTNVVTVTVQAGQTTSDSFTVRAWREKVTIDLFQDNTGHIEGTETFSMSAGGQCQLNGSITDTSEYPTVSPLTLDLDGNGIQTTSVSSTSPLFDLFGAGHKVRSGWTKDALLAYDANGNGRIDNGSELFGGLRGEGYQELARFDTNRNGKIDSGDRRFAKLSVWVDADQDRVTDAGELRSLTAAGVASISLKNHWSGAKQNGNTLGETGTATGTDGHTINVVDLYFPIRD